MSNPCNPGNPAISCMEFNSYRQVVLWQLLKASIGLGCILLKTEAKHLGVFTGSKLP
jgi:hypothetical protein